VHNDRAALAGLLGRLVDACDDRGRIEVESLQERLDASAVRVLLVGEAKRGKSTLGNALLGRQVLPSGVRPVTAITTSIVEGTPERIRVRFRDGREIDGSVEDVASYVTEKENPGNARGVASVTVSLAAVPLAGGVLVDTPGVGSVLAHNTDEARQAMDAMDVAVFVLTADPPISASERELLARTHDRAVATFVVLNKIDRLSTDELADARAFVSEVTGVEEIFECSARAGLEARVADDRDGFACSGVGLLLEALRARLQERAGADLTVSVARAGARLIDGVSSRLSLTRTALDAVAQGRRRDVELFAEELRRATDGDQQALAATAWESRTLRTRLDADAATQVKAMTKDALAALDLLLTEGSASAEVLEGRIRDLLVELIERDASGWRQRWLAELQRAVEATRTRHQALLDRAADAVGEAALRLLGTDVRPVIEPLDVPEVGAFWFDFSPEVGWNTALTDQVRRVLPRRWRHRAIVRHLRDDVASLVDKQVGRARSDLQRRLEEAMRELSAETSARFGQQRDGLGEALDAAKRLGGRTSAEYAARTAGLDRQLAVLEKLRGRLARAAVSGLQDDQSRSA
jgi:GTP-binding protein EngB required for normal cell division